MNPHLPSSTVADEVMTGVLTDAARRLESRGRADGVTVLATIGPEGTSAEGITQQLIARSRAPERLSVLLCPDFDEVSAALSDGRATFALVPSAYRDATAFHWNPAFTLDAAFVHPTPRYGIAALTDPPAHGERLVVAAMSEVQHLFAQLAPDEWRDAEVVYRSAPSTSAAAELVRDGQAHVALCNDVGRERNGLSWIHSRMGANMVWMLFRAR